MEITSTNGIPLAFMVENGRVAVIHFVGRIAEGKDAGAVFDTTDVDIALAEGIYHDHRDYKPLAFSVGEGEVIDGIDTAVRKTAVGETRTIQIEPQEAFGYHQEERVITVPRTELESRNDIDPEEGKFVQSDIGDTGWITRITDETVEIDFNHELAGEPVEFELRVLDVRDADDEGDE